MFDFIGRFCWWYVKWYNRVVRPWYEENKERLNEKGIYIVSDKDCDHLGKGGLRRGLYRNWPSMQEEEKRCGQCGKRALIKGTADKVIIQWI